MVSRSQLPSLLVLAAAIVAGLAVFVLVGRMAGALYGAAALILGLIFHQKLARSRGAEDVQDDLPAEGPKPLRVWRRLPALRAELARTQAELEERDERSAELTRQLEDLQARTRLLQASFAERVTELTAALELQKGEVASALESHERKVAAIEFELGRARHELLQRGAAVGELTRELDTQRAKAQQLADRLAHVMAAQREDQGRLAWSWRAHVEEIAALEAAMDSALRTS